MTDGPRGADVVVLAAACRPGPVGRRATTTGRPVEVARVARTAAGAVAGPAARFTVVPRGAGARRGGVEAGVRERTAAEVRPLNCTGGVAARATVRNVIVVLPAPN